MFLWVLRWGRERRTPDPCGLAFLWSSCAVCAARDGLKVTVPWGPPLTPGHSLPGLGDGAPAAWSSLLPRTGQFSAVNASQPRAQRAETSSRAHCEAGGKGRAEASPSPSQAASCDRVVGHPRTLSWHLGFSAFHLDGAQLKREEEPFVPIEGPRPTRNRRPTVLSGQ